VSHNRWRLPGSGFLKGGCEMVEVLDQLGQLAKERANSLQRTSGALAGDAEGLLVVAKDACQFAQFLAVIWSVMQMRFRKGGVPAKRLLDECDLLLEMGTGTEQHLFLINKVWQERGLTGELAQSIYNEIQETRRGLDLLVRAVREARAQAAAPPRLSATPEMLKQRIRQADEAGEWVKLTDAVSQMRQVSSKQE
jgi:hypothetical protein